MPRVLVFDHTASGVSRDAIAASQVRSRGGGGGTRACLLLPACSTACSPGCRPSAAHRSTDPCMLAQALRQPLCSEQVEGRDVWWQDVIPDQPTECEVTWVGAEDPLFKVRAEPSQHLAVHCPELRGGMGGRRGPTPQGACAPGRRCAARPTLAAGRNRSRSALTARGAALLLCCLPRLHRVLPRLRRWLLPALLVARSPSLCCPAALHHSAPPPHLQLYTSGSTGKPKGVLHTTGERAAL